MMRMRTLAWLVALVAFVVPSFGTAVANHAAAPAMHGAQAASADCPDHAPPPPQDCPAQDTANHAAGQCCPFMAGVVALMSPTVAADATTAFHVQPIGLVPHLTGLVFAKDPPPPRV